MKCVLEMGVARLARIVIPGCPHHVVQRGNRRQRVFFCDGDKAEYLRLISKYASEEGVVVWAYCLMDNHVHLIVVPGTKDGLANGIGEAHKQYTRHVNFRENWRGYLWQGRFLSYPMDEHHLFAAVRYVERNPIRAGIVQRAEDYPWSSARAHIYSLNDPVLTHNGELNRMIGNWTKFLASHECKEDMKAVKQCIKTGRPLGDEQFVKKLEQLTGRRLAKQKPGRKPRSESGDTSLNSAN